jgi:hypothetical protein
MIPTEPDFSDARVKLARASEHTRDLQRRITSFLATDFYRLRFETDHRKQRIKVIFDSLHQPDKIVNAMIGDVVSNLRSVLDYIVVALVAPKIGKSEGIGFPNADNATGFEGEVTKAYLKHSTDIIRKHFIQEVQAYEVGKGRSLWVLNKLRNIDKHRFLLATVSLAGLSFDWIDRDGNIYTNIQMSLMAGNSGTFIDAPANYLEFTNQPCPTFEVMLNEAPHVINTPVIGFLDGLARDVKSTLDAIERVI